jgi:hypothetical protein
LFGTGVCFLRKSKPGSIPEIGILHEATERLRAGALSAM